MCRKRTMKSLWLVWVCFQWNAQKKRSPFPGSVFFLSNYWAVCLFPFGNIKPAIIDNYRTRMAFSIQQLWYESIDRPLQRMKEAFVLQWNYWVAWTLSLYSMCTCLCAGRFIVLINVIQFSQMRKKWPLFPLASAIINFELLDVNISVTLMVVREMYEVFHSESKNPVWIAWVTKVQMIHLEKFFLQTA